MSPRPVFHLLPPSAALWLALAPPAAAFPPAPAFTFCGTARDAYGYALRPSAQATLVVMRGSESIAEGPIDDRLGLGENFRIALSLDLDETPAADETLSPGELVYFVVRFPSGTVPVSSIQVGDRTVGQPAGKTVLDFTIGEDSDGDGLPDAWEYWQLSQAGIGGDDPRNSLATFGEGDFDGDGRSDHFEYVAGTFAFLQHSGFGLRIDSVDGDGFAQLRTDVVANKSYFVESSTDLRTWTPVAICLDGDRNHPVMEFTAEASGELRFESPPPEPGNGPRYFRTTVR